MNDVSLTYLHSLQVGSIKNNSSELLMAIVALQRRSMEISVNWVFLQQIRYLQQYDRNIGIGVS